ncbi:MAG: hypothetical protein NTZ18_05045 [Candidatus Komeilibacteria bacterium]|nr:hypothetical protein [Candidatus Komeilibacteria bacterium]
MSAPTAKPFIPLDQGLEQKVKNEALTYLKKGKPVWDVYHALKSVEYMKELLKHEGGNGRILITATYLLNIGYGLTNIAKEKEIGFVTVLKFKQQHAILGSQEAEKVLRKMGDFTEEEIKEITRLVLVHDEWWNTYTKDFVKNFNDFMVTEADTLGMIDPAVPQNFSIEDQKKFLEESLLPFRAPLFKTLYGKVKLKELIGKAMEQVEGKI